MLVRSSLPEEAAGLAPAAGLVQPLSCPDGDAVRRVWDVAGVECTGVVGWDCGFAASGLVLRKLGAGAAGVARGIGGSTSFSTACTAVVRNRSELLGQTPGK